jgi:hypothetical protein
MGWTCNSDGGHKTCKQNVGGASGCLEYGEGAGIARRMDRHSIVPGINGAG